MSTGNDTTLEAVNAVAMGFAPVIPLHPRSKRPLFNNWPEIATRDPAIIAKWFGPHSDRNVGAVMEGLLALDIDADKGGFESLAELEKEFGPLPETVESQTGNGGRHKFFSVPEGIRIPNRVGFKPGLDTRGSGGQVVVPPSVNDKGKPYLWVNAPGKYELAPAPSWLLDLVLSKEKETVKDVPDSDGFILEGCRNSILFKLACSLWTRGVNREALAGAIAAINLHQCRPSLPQADIRQIVESVTSRYHRGEITPRYQMDGFPPAV